MKIPLINLKKQYETIKDDVDKSVQDVLESTQFIMGYNVKEFEKEFGYYLGIKNSISVANGTDALVISLKALGVGKGDEVITTPWTFFATAESISFVGAKPVFVDVELDTFNIDPSKIEAAITPKTKAIMVVHVFGQPCDMDGVSEIAKKYNLFVIEDAAQAIGSEYKGRKIGTLSDIATFSFFPTKNLGCAGDGGMIVTDDDDLATICKALRAHGSGEMGQKAFKLLHNINIEVVSDSGFDNTVYNPFKYYNYIIGHNSRLDEIQAAILRIKLDRIDEWNEVRRSIAEFYNNSLKGTDIITPYENGHLKHVYHLYIVQSDNRNKLVQFLEKSGVSTGTYYPVPLHLQKAFVHLGYREGDMPNAEYLSHRTLALPMFAELSDVEKNFIVDTILEFEGQDEIIRNI